VARFGEGEQAGQRGCAGGQCGVEVETGEVIEDIDPAATGVGGDGDGRPVTRVGHETSRVTQDEPNIGIASPNTIAHQQVRGSRSVEQEVGRERRDVRHSWPRQLAGVDERVIWF
jgi:hypothetical protein